MLLVHYSGSGWGPVMDRTADDNDTVLIQYQLLCIIVAVSQAGINIVLILTVLYILFEIRYQNNSYFQ